MLQHRRVKAAPPAPPQGARSSAAHTETRPVDGPQRPSLRIHGPCAARTSCTVWARRLLGPGPTRRAGRSGGEREQHARRGASQPLARRAARVAAIASRSRCRRRGHGRGARRPGPPTAGRSPAGGPQRRLCARGYLLCVCVCLSAGEVRKLRMLCRPGISGQRICRTLCGYFFPLHAPQYWQQGLCLCCATRA